MVPGSSDSCLVAAVEVPCSSGPCLMVEVLDSSGSCSVVVVPDSFDPCLVVEEVLCSSGSCLVVAYEVACLGCCQCEAVEVEHLPYPGLVVDLCNPCLDFP